MSCGILLAFPILDDIAHIHPLGTADGDPHPIDDAVRRAHHSATTAQSGTGNSLPTSIAVRNPWKGMQIQRQLLMLDSR